MIPMRDGVRLATDIYRPTHNGQPVAEPLPVILHRTPYNKARGDKPAPDAAFFAQHGYVVVYQDCRGRYRSEGTFTKYVNEPEDGFDTIAWLTRQPWCNGKVGMRGGSYLAHVQAGAAKLNTPGLATIVVTVGGTSNGWTHGIRQQGTFALKQLTWAFSNLRAESDDPVVKARLSTEKVADWVLAMPWRRGQNPLSTEQGLPARLRHESHRGILRARYRNSPERAELMEPGKTYPLTIETYGTANVFKKGHRIRVDISSSNFPAFDVNPNTGEPLGRNRRAVKADNTIHHARATPSMIVLPIVPLHAYRPDTE